MGTMTYQTTDIDNQIDSIYDTLDALAVNPNIDTADYRSILSSVVERCTDSIDRIDFGAGR